MPSITRKRPAVTFAVVAALLVTAAPAQAGIAVGSPSSAGTASVISPRDSSSGQPTGVVGPQPAALLDAHMEI